MKTDLSGYSDKDIETAIDNWIKGEKARKILKRRLLDAITYEALAEEFEMSVSQIKRIVYKQELVLFSHI